MQRLRADWIWSCLVRKRRCTQAEPLQCSQLMRARQRQRADACLCSNVLFGLLPGSRAGVGSRERGLASLSKTMWGKVGTHLMTRASAMCKRSDRLLEPAVAALCLRCMSLIRSYGLAEAQSGGEWMWTSRAAAKFTQRKIFSLCRQIGPWQTRLCRRSSVCGNSASSLFRAFAASHCRRRPWHPCWAFGCTSPQLLAIDL